MEISKISEFIRTKRKELGLTQEKLAEKLFVTEKAISRWETGRGTPDISLLLPLSKELNVDVRELLCGEDIEKNEIEKLIEYNEISKKQKYNLKFKFIILLYFLSILVFLFYLKFEYDPNMEINYFIRLFTVLISSVFIIIANKIFENNYVEKNEDKDKIFKFSLSILFIYYSILLFNTAIYARYYEINSYNLVPFKSIIDILKTCSLYSIIINIFGNLLIFMPFQFFIIELFKINKFKINFFISVFLIITIELAQFVFHVGVLDVDDLILCVIGMTMFYFIYNKYFKN